MSDLDLQAILAELKQSTDTFGPFIRQQAEAIPDRVALRFETETVTYKVGDTTFKGFLVYDDATKDKRPGVMVVHEWWGVSSYERKRAEQLAKLGYVALADPDRSR